MPVVFTPAAIRKRRRSSRAVANRLDRRSSQTAIRKKPATRPNRFVLCVLWAVALVAIVAIFLGGAGLIMIGAGHRTVGTLALVGLGAGAAVYLGWFLTVGPGKEPEKSAAPFTPRTTSVAPAVEIDSGGYRLLARRLRCFFCGTTESAHNRLIWGDRAAICEKCAVTAGRVAGTLDHEPASLSADPRFVRGSRSRYVPPVPDGMSAHLPDPRLSETGGMDTADAAAVAGSRAG